MTPNEMAQEQVFMTNANKTTAPGKQEPTSEELSEEELNHVTVVLTVALAVMAGASF
jgi:hypothetical protein